MSTMEIKTGKIPSKGWVGVMISLKTPSPVEYLYRETPNGVYVQDVMNKVTREWLSELGATNGFYGEGMFFASIPVDKLKYVDRASTKISYIHSHLMATHVFLYDVDRKRKYPEGVELKMYYLPTVEEVQDFISMAHDKSLTRSLITWYYKWMRTTGAAKMLHNIKVKDPSTDVTMPNVLAALKAASPSMKKIKAIIKENDIDTENLDKGTAYTFDSSTGRYHVIPRSSSIETNGKHLREEIASNILLDDNTFGLKIGAITPSAYIEAHRDLEGPLRRAFIDKKTAEPGMCTVERLKRKKKREGISKNNVISFIKGWLNK